MTELPAIGTPARAALAAAGLTKLEHLAGWSRTRLLALHGVGPKAIRLLEPAMQAHDLAFAPDEIARRTRSSD